MASHPAPTLPAPDTPQSPIPSDVTQTPQGRALAETRLAVSRRRGRTRLLRGVVAALSPALVGAAALLLW